MLAGSGCGRGEGPGRQQAESKPTPADDEARGNARRLRLRLRRPAGQQGGSKPTPAVAAQAFLRMPCLAYLIPGACRVMSLEMGSFGGAFDEFGRGLRAGTSR